MAEVVVTSGARRHLVRLEYLGAPVADSDGGFTSTPVDLSPAYAFASIEPATARTLERIAAGTVVSNASHIVSMRYHSGVTTKTQIVYGTRTFQVTGVINPEERNVTTVALCTEVVA